MGSDERPSTGRGSIYTRRRRSRAISTRHQTIGEAPKSPARPPAREETSLGRQGNSKGKARRGETGWLPTAACNENERAGTSSHSSHLGKRPESKSGKPLMVNLRMLPSLPCDGTGDARTNANKLRPRERPSSHASAQDHHHHTPRKKKSAENGRAIGVVQNWHVVVATLEQGEREASPPPNEQFRTSTKRVPCRAGYSSEQRRASRALGPVC